MKEALTFFLENWHLILLGICAFILMVAKIVEFIGYPTSKKKEIIKNVLLYYVTEAELELGGGTGAIKLAKVYDYFVQAFPHVVKWISYEEFDNLVQEVLPTMKELLKTKEILH